MRITKDKSEDSRNLREQAEKRAKQPIVEFRKERREDTAELIHELRVHQIELEIQNEELRNAQLELADSRNKYCELYDFAPVGYFTLNKEGLIVGANLTGASFLGEERDNLLKSKFSHFIAPGSQDDFYLHHKQVVESGTMQNCEVKLHRKDGTEFPAQLVSVAVAEQKGEYGQFRMTMIDITEQKKVENARRESEERYRSLFDNMLEGSAYCKMTFKNNIPHDFVYVAVNSTFEKLTGLKNVAGKRVTEVIPGIKESNPELFEIYGRVALTGQPEKFETYLPSLGIWLSIAVYSPAKEYFVAIFENITERKKAEEMLRESEDKFRHVFDYSAIGKSITFLSGEMQANKALCKMLGYSEEELKVKKWQEITHPDDVEDSQKAIDSILSGQKELVQLFKRYICKNGSVVWADVSSSLRRDNEGKPLYLMTSMVNITERKLAEEKLQQASNYNRSLIEASPDPLVTIGPDGKITDVNTATEAVTGYIRTILIGTDFSDYFTEPKMAQAGYQQVFKEGVVHDYPLEIRHRDGHVTPVLYNASIYRDKTGKVMGIFAAARNITKRKQAEEKLQEERNLLRTLIDHIPGEIYVKDKDGRFLACNKPVAELWKARNKGSIIGKTDFDLFEQEQAQRYFDEEQKVIQTGQPIINQESQCTDKSGTANFLLVTKVPLRDSSGNITGLVGIHRDITEHKQTEQKILEYQKHLKRLAARLTLAEEEERRRIAGAIHDDISQTLALAKIKLDTLQSSQPSKESSAEIRQISSCIEKVIQETRTLTFELSNPILYELGFEAAVAEWLNEQIQIKHGIATEFLDDGKAKPLDDNVKVMLFRNVCELLINCIKHAKAETIRVNVRRIDNSIEVIVEDNGAGFDPVQVRATAFKKAKFGLFSVRESLENIGGSFEIESKPGAGCKATMIAPIKNAKTNKEIDHAYENFIS